jgi:DNA-binding LacI/PurR family transcriptional regulator
MMAPKHGSKRMKKAPSDKGKVGLREIASAANVSLATASRVLSGNTRVDRAIQKVVLEEAKKLGIDPAERNKTKTLAFLLSNRAMLHVFHSRILSGAEAHCAANCWDMVYLSFNYSPHAPWTELHLPRVVQRHDVIRAVILAGTNSANLIKLLVHKGIMFVVLGNNVVGEQQDLKNNDVVFADDIQGGRMRPFERSEAYRSKRAEITIMPRRPAAYPETILSSGEQGCTGATAPGSGC